MEDLTSLTSLAVHAGPFAIGVILLWWRMARVEKAIDRSQEIQEDHGERISNMEGRLSIVPVPISRKPR